MSDQCKWCIVRGDMTACTSTECFQHENWHAIQINQQLADLKAENDILSGASKELQLANALLSKENKRLKKIVRENCDNIGGDCLSYQELYEECVKIWDKCERLQADKDALRDKNNDKILWMLKNASRIARAEYRNKPTWVFVMEVMSVGSTSAYEICKSLNIEPEEKAKSAIEQHGNTTL